MASPADVDGLLAALAAPGADADAAEAHLADLRRLVLSDGADRNRLAKAPNAFQTLAAVLGAHPASPAVQARGIQVLSVALQDAEVAGPAAASGIVPPVAAAMAAFPAEQEVQSFGVAVLHNLAVAGKVPAAEVATTEGALAALVKALETLPENTAIQTQGCKALSIMSEESEMIQATIRDVGAIQAVLHTMDMFENSAPLQQTGIEFLRNMSRKSDKAQLLIGELSGIEAICKAMSIFGSEEGLLTAGCAAFRFLAFNRDNRTKIGDAGGITAIVEALKTLQSVPQRVESVFKAMNNATYDNIGNKTAAGRCGGIQVVIEVMERYRNLPELQEDGCRLLRNLADGVELNRRIIADVGGINAVLFAMTTHPNHVGISEHGCATLLTLCKNDALLQYIRAADVTRLVESRMDLHRDNLEVQKYGTELLETLNNTKKKNGLLGSQSRSQARSRSRAGASRSRGPGASSAKANQAFGLSRSGKIDDRSRSGRLKQKGGLFSRRDAAAGDDKKRFGLFGKK